MAQSDDAKLDELKRLLQRLDRALPVGPQTAFDFPAARIETRVQEADPPPTPHRPQFADAATRSPAAHKQHPPVLNLRTAFVAAGLSAMVSLGVVAMLFITPEGNSDAPWRNGLRSAVEQVYGRFSAQTANASAKTPAEESPPAQRAEIAELEAAPRLPLPSAAIVDEPPSGQAPASPSAGVIPVKQEQSVPAPPEVALPVTETVPDLPEASLPAAPASESPDKPQEIAAHETSDPESLADLDASQFLRRGLLMLSGGSVGAAQLLLERAADLGNGDAAFTLATTYDAAPGAPRRGAAGRPNAELALRWYERARELGVAEAGKRLGELKTAGTQLGEGG